ncbi:MAG: hypothetical protein K9N49_08840 [Candidatus Marinimicrobia bacterium]|nr:hypothetical protein [Candidatus Neomarinimicrobiota bacterium]
MKTVHIETSVVSYLAARRNYDVRRLAESLMVKEGASGHVIFDLHARKKHRRINGGTVRR